MGLENNSKIVLRFSITKAWPRLISGHNSFLSVATDLTITLQIWQTSSGSIRTLEFKVSFPSLSGNIWKKCPLHDRNFQMNWSFWLSNICCCSTLVFSSDFLFMKFSNHVAGLEAKINIFFVNIKNLGLLNLYMKNSLKTYVNLNQISNTILCLDHTNLLKFMLLTFLVQ